MTDPLRLEQRWLRRAAWLRWRADPAASVATAVMGLALVAVAAWLLLAVLGRVSAAWLQSHALLLGAAACVATFADHAHALARWRRSALQGWLGCLPTLPLHLWPALTRWIALRLAVQSTLLLVALAVVALGPSGGDLRLAALAGLAGMGSGSAAAWLHAWRRQRGADPAATAHEWQPRSVPGWRWLPPMPRWQQVEALAGSVGGPSARRFGLLLLLVPFGLSPAGTVAALLAMLLLGAALAAWSSALRIVPRAAALLAATPLAAGAFLRGVLGLPATMLLVALLSMGPLLWLLGAPAMWLPLGAALLLGAALHAATVCAWRREPRRIALAVAVQLALPLAVLQGLPPALPLVLALQFGWLWRRMRRP